MKHPSSLRTLALAALAPTLALATAAHGQAIYIATQRPAPYLALAGGTQAFPFGAGDSGLNVPLGFTFTFYGVQYDTVALTENGALSFQAECSRMNPSCDFDEFCNGLVCERQWFPSPSRGGFPNPNPPTRVVAPFWAPLFMDMGTNPVSEVRYLTQGVAPNREFVAEWRNIRTDFFGGGPQASRWSFQARLSEATGNIRFHYGPFVSGQDAQFISGLIGIQSGQDYLNGHACSSSSNGCTSVNLQALQNQIIELGRPNGPELTGSVRILSGAEPGRPAVVAVTARNVGLQPTPGGFVADVYLGLSSPIIPVRDTNLGRVNFGVVPSGGTATATLTATIPAALAIGRYFVSAYIDANLQVPESTEANNIVEATDSMLIGADMAGGIDEFPSGVPGQPATVEAYILNYSSAQPSVAWRLYLSTDSSLDPGDTELSRGTTAVAGGGHTFVRPSFTYPSVPAGYYQLLFVVDPASVINEVDEFNNVGPSVQFILGPELEPSFVSAPGRTGPGETVQLNVAIRSLGAAVPALPFSIWLSRDTTFNIATDIRIAQEVRAVGAGTTEELVVTATIPASVMPAAYHLVLEIDPQDAVSELEELNNVWIGTDTVQLTGPDVSSTTLSSDPMAFRTLPFRVAATFENVGGQTVSNVRYSFHLSVNQLITVTDPQIHIGGPITLRPGERAVVTATTSLRADFAPGQYYIGVIADTDGSVTEQDEGNNIRRNVVRVVVRDTAPDFLLSEIITPREAAVGERVTVQRLVENVGNAAGSGAYEVRLVPIGGSSADGYALGRGTVTIAAGGASDGIDTVRIPTTVPAGDYEIEYVMDPDAQVDELEERNNALRGAEALRVEQAQLEIVTKSLPVGVIGVPYDATLISQGGVAAISWRVISGALPAGLTLAPSGRITGSPTAEAQASFVVEVSDGSTASTRDLQLLVAAGQAELDLITRALPAAYAGQTYEYPLVAVGGIPPYVWSYDGALAPGFVLTSSGTIAGISEQEAGSRVITFRVQDARGDVVERPLSFRVLDGSEGVRFGDGALPDGVVGDGYEASVAVAGGESPYTFAVGTGELPPGLTLDGGVVRGTPTRAGVYTVELSVTDGRGNVDLAMFVITVVASGELRFVTTGLPAGTLNQPYTDEGSQTVQLRVLAPVDASSVAISLVSGALPTGLTLDADGRIQGTPTAAGVFAFVAVVADGEGRSATGAFGIAIAGPVVVEPPPTEDGGCSTTSPTGAGAWALLLLAGLVLKLRRMRGVLVIAAMVVGTAALTRAAEAQFDGGRPVPPPPPPPFDGGVGPGGDGGTNPGSARYFFSTRNAPYSERTGGTPFQFRDIDNSAVVVSLPFPFRLFEDDFTSASIGTNGFMSFVGDASWWNGNGFPDGFEPNGVIAPWAEDLYNPEITTYVEGTAPNRVYIVQWRNTSRCCGGSGVFFNFQVHLFEGAAGRMEFHYGPISGAGMDRFGGSIGFEDGFGSRGFHLASCSPGCTQSDMSSLVGTVLVAVQDAGEDVIANRLVPQVGGVGRVYQGVPFTVQANYASYHANPIGPFVYRVHLVPRGSTTLNNPIFTSAPITLGAYEERDDALELTLPLSVAPGRYTLALEVDADRDVTEPDETNNVVVSRTELIVAGRGPNFVVGAVDWSERGPVAPGASGTVQVELRNEGNLDGTAAYRVVLSGNAVASLDDVTLASGSIALAMGQTEPVQVPVTLPTGLRSGNYWIGVIADPAGAVAELFEIDNAAVSAPLTIENGALSITTTSLPPAYRGLEYSSALVADGVGIESWSLTAGALPEGLTLASGGFINGRPTEVGSFTFTAEVRASSGATATRELTLEVQAAMGPLSILTRQILPGVVGQPYPPSPANTPVAQQQHIVSSGGSGAVTFRLVGDAPEGLVLESDGYLHGTTLRRGTFPLTVEARAGAETVTAMLELVVVDAGRLTLVPQTLPVATVGAAYVATLTAVGVVEPTNVELTLVEGAGDLPDGLALSSRGTITGTASVTGRFVFSVRATEALGARVVSDTASFEIQVDASAGFSITPAAVPDATVGVPYTVTLEARLGTPPYVWATVESRRLPRGLRAEVETVEGVQVLTISGTPEEVPTDAQIGDRTGGIATFRASVTDAGGQSAQAAYALRVLAAPAAPPPPTEEGGCSCASATPGMPIEGLLMVLAMGALVLRRRR